MNQQLPTGLPPKKFAPAGFVVWAQNFPHEPQFLRGTKPKGSRAEGVRYEAKVQEFLKSKFPPESLISSPWFVFKSGSHAARDRFCQPDALLIDSEAKHVTIIEIKLQHTAFAWWQVRQLYEPVLRRVYTNHTFSAIEIVKWLDPNIAFPETFYYAESVEDRGSGTNKFGVHIFDPRGRW